MVDYWNTLVTPSLQYFITPEVFSGDMNLIKVSGWNVSNILMIAGEVSGDLHGAALITELKKLDAGLEIYGIGGDKMQAAGMKIIYHINRMAFLGFVEVVKHLPFIKKAQQDLLKLVKEKDIRNVVLIDYPGFNLSIAKKFICYVRHIFGCWLWVIGGWP